MKNLFLVSVVLLSSFNLYSQIKEVSFGMMLPVGATAGLPFQEKPFEFSVGLAPSINIITSKTHHHIRYGVSNYEGANNSIQTINGYFLKNDWDVYNFFLKNLNSHNKYLGFGIEKRLPVNDYLAIFFYTELGTNFEGKGLASFGLVIHPHLKIR